MVATVNNLLQPAAQAAWRELSVGEQLRAATTLLDTVEQGAFVLADNLLKTDIVQENADNIREYEKCVAAVAPGNGRETIGQIKTGYKKNIEKQSPAAARRSSLMRFPR